MIFEVMFDCYEDDVLVCFGVELVVLLEVFEVYLVLGEYDYWIKVVVDGMVGYECFLCEKLYWILSICYSCLMFVLWCMKDVFLI